MLKPAATNRYENVRVLVLEDETHIRQIICRLLRQIGFTLIEEASDGTEGFKEILRKKPDIILCDIHMEPIDGLAFARKLRNLGHAEYSRIPIIFLTADSEQGTVMQAKELHVAGYLTKPVSQNQLKDRLDRVLNK